MAPYRRTTRVARLAIVAAILALVLGIAANTGTAIQAYRNCQRIGEIEQRIHDVLEESLVAAESGARDDAYKKNYGAAWKIVKEADIKNLTKQVHKFDPQGCSFLIH